MPRYADTSGYTPEEMALWDKLLAHEREEFSTAKGFRFTYEVRGNELFVDRKEKSITRATVNRAYRKAAALGGLVPGPKALGTFGASYLYPIFCRIGVVRRAEEQDGPPR